MSEKMKKEYNNINENDNNDKNNNDKNYNDNNNKNIYNKNLKKQNKIISKEKYIFYTPDGVGFNINFKKN